MRTLSLGAMSKRKSTPWPQAKPTTLQRLGRFLVKDLLPSILMVLIVSLFALYVGAKIDQAKSSSADRGVEISGHP